MVAAATNYHKWIPRDQVEHLRWRHLAYRRMQSDERFADAMRQASSEDILFWVNLAIWTYDPGGSQTRRCRW